MMRRLGIALAALVAVWLVLVAVIYIEMCRPPEKFAAFVARVPGPLFLALPFETLWSLARGGTLHNGDVAPDFDLQTVDKTGSVRLSSLRGVRPVVLIFGSYT
jgi:hypothetical protein